MVEGVADRRGTARVMQVAALWCVAAFAFSIPYENGFTIAGVGTVARLIGTVAIAVTVLSLIDAGRVRLRAPSLFLLVAVVYLVWSGASYLWSIDPSRTLGRVTSLAQLTAMAWMIHQVAATQRQRDLLAQSFVFGAYAAVLLALGVRLVDPSTAYRDVGGMNPNWLSIGCALAIPVAWGLALRVRHRVLFWVNAVYPVFALVLVVLAASRGGMITALVAMSVIPLTMPRLRLGRRILLIAVLVALGVGVSVLGPQSYAELAPNVARLAQAPEELGEGTLTGRTIIWQSGLEAFRAAPLLGHGAGTFSRAVAEDLGRARGAHNGYLSTVVAVGVIGLALYLGLFVVAAVGTVRAASRRLELLVVLATVMTALMPANMEHTKVIWFVLSLVAVSRPVFVTADVRVKDIASVPGHQQRPWGRVVESR